MPHFATLFPCLPKSLFPFLFFCDHPPTTYYGRRKATSDFMRRSPLVLPPERTKGEKEKTKTKQQHQSYKLMSSLSDGSAEDERVFMCYIKTALKRVFTNSKNGLKVEPHFFCCVLSRSAVAVVYSQGRSVSGDVTFVLWSIRHSRRGFEPLLFWFLLWIFFGVECGLLDRAKRWDKEIKKGGN